MTDVALLKRVWLLLIGMTMITFIVMESADPSRWVLVVVTIIISVKGRLVVDYLMGMKYANPIYRKVMLSYFYILPPLIALALIFTDELRQLTTL